ncbi:MAG: sugar-binding protein [Clostridia bacterium]|nr:sugar-binding protein [Clostridia bacterium]
MNKILSFLLAAVMVMPLTGCGSSGSGAAGKKTLGIAMPTKTAERWNRDGTYLKEKFEAVGYNVELKYSNTDSYQQNNDIQTLIADEVDLLIVAAVDGDALTQTLADAGYAGIPVIAYDRLINHTNAVSYYVSFDNYAVGELQAKYIIDKLGLDLNNTSVSYNMEIVSGAPSDNNAYYFYDGAMDILKPYMDAGIIKVPSEQTTFEQTATENWSTDLAFKRMQNILGSFYANGTVLDIALCFSDCLSLGVTQAIQSDYSGGNIPITVGQDGDIAVLANIVDGLQSMTIYKNVGDEAEVTLELAKAILSGETPAGELTRRLSMDCAFDTKTYDNGSGIVPSYLLAPVVITADNLDDLVETGLYKWDGKYLVSATSE